MNRTVIAVPAPTYRRQVPVAGYTGLSTVHSDDKPLRPNNLQSIFAPPAALGEAVERV